MRAIATLIVAACVAGLSGLAASYTARAQPAPAEKTPHERRIEAMEAEEAVLKAQAALERERAAIEKSRGERIGQLGLPSFDGEVELKGTAGTLEAGLLSTAAVQAASRLIADAVPSPEVPGPESKQDAAPQPAPLASGGPQSGADGLANFLNQFLSSSQRGPAVSQRSGDHVVVLAGDETLETFTLDLVRQQLEVTRNLLVASLPRGQELLVGGDGAFYNRFDQVASFAESRSPDLLGALSTPLQIGSAILGALRSEVEVNAVSTSAINDQLLATAVAGRLGERARLASAPLSMPPASLASTDNVVGKLLEIVRLHAELIAFRDSAPLAGDANKPLRDRLTLVGNHAESVVKGMVTTENGRAPIATAARLEQLLKGQPRILRVYVNQSGGSLVNTQNIGTFFGGDPLRVSGGLIASYRLTDLATGQVVRAGVFPCRTAQSRLRHIQDGSWVRRVPHGSTAADCLVLP